MGVFFMTRGNAKKRLVFRRHIIGLRVKRGVAKPIHKYEEACQAASELIMTKPSFKRRFVFTLSVFIFAGLLFLFAAKPASADGILVTAPERIDGVFSADNKIVYISNGDRVLRYDLTSQTFLSPYIIGGHLMGMDLSPDGNTLAVADSTFANGQLWIHLVNLSNGIDQKVFFTSAWYEGGSFTVAYGADGALLITSEYQGSGWTPMRRYEPSTGISSTLGTLYGSQVRQSTMLSASGDKQTIGLVEANASNGPWSRFIVISKTILSGADTNWFTYEIAVNKNGSQFAIPTYGGTFVYNLSATKIYTLGTYASSQPIGVAYHPTLDKLFTAWTGTKEVRIYDSNTFQQIDSFDANYTFQSNGNWAFQNGRLKTSRDGSLFLATVAGGVQVFSAASNHTLLTVSASSNPVIAGNLVTLTGSVQRIAPATGIPSGTISFFEPDQYGELQQVATGTLNLNGQSVFTAALSAGTHPITAVYGGNLADRSSSATFTVTVQKSGTTTTGEISPVTPLYRNPLTVTVHVTSSNPLAIYTPTGYINVFEGSNYLTGSSLDALGQGQIYIGSGFSVGNHCLIVSYYGDNYFDTSNSSTICFTVDRAESEISISGSTFKSGDFIVATIGVTVTAIPKYIGPPTGQIAIYVDDIYLGTISLDWLGKSNFSLFNLANTTHKLDIVYLGNSNFKSSNKSFLIDNLHHFYMPYTTKDFSLDF